MIDKYFHFNSEIQVGEMCTQLPKVTRVKSQSCDKPPHAGLFPLHAFVNYQVKSGGRDREGFNFFFPHGKGHLFSDIM